MTKTPQKNNNDSSEGQEKNGDITPEQIVAEAERLQALNAQIEKELGKYLKADYAPEGAYPNELKEKVIEAEDKRQQDEMAAELDGRLTEIFARISDIRSQE